MLSRVADALFWMSRYLERAEHVARLLDVCFHLELDLRGVTAGLFEMHWTSLSAILQQIVPPSRDPTLAPQAQLTQWLTLDLDNPTSIMSSISRARLNARSIRGAINSEMWKELNKLYWHLSDPQFSEMTRDSPYEFFQAVESGSHVFQGVCDATLSHDEGWHFIQLGKYIERAEKTLRILDIQYHLLQELANPADLPMSNLQWGGVLRSCRAYESFQRSYVGRVDPDCVVEFLLLEDQFPRSVRFSLEACARALTAIEGHSMGRLGPADRILGRVLCDLRYADLDQMLDGGLHTFLSGVLERCNQISRTVQEQYFLR